jgi:hypothetical protein
MKNVLACVLVAIAVSGCASIGKAPEIAKTEYQVERLPLTAGIYYPAELRDYLSTVDRSVEPGRAFYHDRIPFGLPAVQSIDFALDSLFAKLVELSEWPPVKPSSEVLDLVIVPRIIALEYPAGARLGVTLFTSSGDALDTFEIDGVVANDFWDRVKSRDSNIKNILTLNLPPEPLFKTEALRNAAAQLVVTLAAHPVMTSMVAEKTRDAATARSQDASDEAIGQARTAMGLAIIPKLLPQTLERQSPPDVEGCLEKAFTKLYPGIELATAQSVRQAVFPWLELGIAPDNEEELLGVLRRPFLLARLNDINVRYVTLPTLTNRGDFTGPFFCGGGYGGAGCLGYMSGEFQSTLSGQLWDLATGRALGEPLLENAKATSWVAGFVIPFGHGGDTAGNACAKMAGDIARRMTR